MKKIFRKNQLVITALALMIAVAGYFSYMNNNMDDGKLQTAAEAANAEVSAGELEEDYDISDDQRKLFYRILSGLSIYFEREICTSRLKVC